MIYANLPWGDALEQDVQPWIDDDCGGTAVQTTYWFGGETVYKIINGNEAR